MIAFSKIGKAFTLGSKAAPWVQNLITNTGSGAISQAIVSYGEGKSSSEILMSSASVGIVSGGSGLFMEKILAPFAQLSVNGIRNTAINMANKTWQPAFATSYSTGVNG